MNKSEFDPLELIRRLNKSNIRYLLIGRQAVVQYGAPLFSFDYDFWIDPADRGKTFAIIESFGLISGGKKTPIVIFDDDEGNKVDVFFTKTLASEFRNIKCDFETAFKRSVIKKDPDTDFFVRIPHINDLVLLKQLGEMAPKDYEDVEYLKNIKNRGNRPKP